MIIECKSSYKTCLIQSKHKSETGERCHACKDKTYLYMFFHSLHSFYPLLLHDADTVPYVHKPGHGKIDLTHKRKCQSFTVHKNKKK